MTMFSSIASPGHHATPDAVTAVKAVKLAATVQQKHGLIGKMGVDTAKLLIEGKPVDRNILVPLALVTQERPPSEGGTAIQ